MLFWQGLAGGRPCCTVSRSAGLNKRKIMRSFFCILLCLLSFSGLNARQDYNIVFVGNSITFGALHQDASRTAPPVVCARWLEAQEGVGQCNYVNMGKSGRTTFNFVPVKTDLKNHWQELKVKTEALVQQHPEAQLVFSFMLGTNDTAERPSNSRTTPYMYRHNLELMIDSLLQIYPNARFVLHRPIFFSTPFTTKNGSLQSKESPKMLAKYFRELKAIVARYAGRYPERVYMGDRDAYNFFKKNYRSLLIHEKGYRDCDFWLHPNEEGSRILGEYWGRAIVKALGVAGK